MHWSWKLCLVVLPVLGGCVTRSTYELKQQELTSCRADQARWEEQAKSDRKLAIAMRERMETTLADTRADLEECSRAKQAASQLNERLATREASLRAMLHAELEARDVEISRLKDQLSVRVLDKILFRSGSADILPEGHSVLDKLARVLKETDDYVRVEGHTDIVPIGKRLKEKFSSNWELSVARATNVVRHFEYSHGIDPSRMEAVGFSKYRPVTSGDTPEELRRNRRVEIVLTEWRGRDAASNPTKTTQQPDTPPQ